MKSDAKKRQSDQPILIPGDIAPHFESESTYGTIRLNDYAGQWVILFSRPADFCPTWANEIQRFADHFCNLKDLNCALIGFNSETERSPLMWSKAVQDEFGVKIWFPVLFDKDNEIAKVYGMISSEEEYIGINRSIHVIDDKQILRAIVYYDPTHTDTLDELVRLVRMLRINDVCGIVTTESWRPGDEWILEPVRSVDSSNHEQEEMWYF